MGNVLLWTTLSHEYMAIFVKKQIDGHRTSGVLEELEVFCTVAKR